MAVYRTLAFDDAVDRAIAAIYDTAITAGGWPRALGALKDVFNLGSTAYVVHDAARTWVRRVSDEPDTEAGRALFELLLKGSFVYAHAGAGRPGEVIRAAAVAPPAAFRRSRIYQEYWRPRDLHDGLRLTLDVEPGGAVHALNLIRARTAGLFGPGDIALAENLVPHLCRAVTLRRRLRQTDLLAASALRVLDMLPHGILLLDRSGRVTRANAAGAALLSCQDGLRSLSGKLAAASPAETNRLHAVVAAAAGRADAPPRAGALRLRRPRAGTPLALLAMPFHQETDWTVPVPPAVLVAVCDPYAGHAPPERQMALLFGLTPAEAALAAALLSGLAPAEIAARSGRRVSTVRTLLARLMAKTEVRRQADLPRVLGAVPRFDGAA